MRRPLKVLIAVSAIFFVASAITFASLGIVAFAMQGQFHWSDAQAGGAFLAVGLMAAVSAMLPVVLIARIGAAQTVLLGLIVLPAACALCALTHALPWFYVGAGLLGVGYSLVANTTGIYLIAGWFGERSPRMIGLYLMSGTLGNAAGPPEAAWVMAHCGGWRGYWWMTAAILLALAAAAMVLLRNPALVASPAVADPQDKADWNMRDVVMSPHYAVLAAAMVLTQTCLLTVESVAAPHLVSLGGTSVFAATILGLQALVGTAATGLAGFVTEKRDPKLVLGIGLLVQGAGVMLLAFGAVGWSTYVFALVFGIGWSVTSLAVTVLLIRFYGTKAGTTALSSIWMLSALAAIGPSVAGLVADRTGSFAAPLGVLGCVLLPVAVAAFAIGTPRRRKVEALVASYHRN